MIISALVPILAPDLTIGEFEGSENGPKVTCEPIAHPSSPYMASAALVGCLSLWASATGTPLEVSCSSLNVEMGTLGNR